MQPYEQMRSTRPVAATRAQAFADRTAARFGRWSAWAQPAGRIWPRAARPFLLTLLNRHALYVAPHVRVALALAEHHSLQLVRTQPGRDRETVHALERILLRSQRELLATPERPLARSTAQSPAPGAPRPTVRAAAIDRVLRRTPAPRVEERMTAGAPNEVTVAPFPGRRPDPLPPAELTRVTDHVLRAIDRQMTAARERLGRR